MTIQYSEYSVFVSCAQFLHRCRVVGESWIKKLAHQCELSDDAEVTEGFRRRLVDVALMGCLTFSDDEFLLGTTEDASQWLYFRAVLNENLSLSEFKESYEENVSDSININSL